CSVGFGRCCGQRSALRSSSRMRTASVAGALAKKRTPPLPCVTVPLNLLETGGTRRVAFDFQSRPVGHNLNSDPLDYSLRFKDIVSNHVHRQGKFLIPIKNLTFAVKLDLFSFPKNPDR